jgi:pyruvate-ferredoxin/flavodoxin oxidoreductase
MKVYEPSAIDAAPAAFKHKDWKDREHPGLWMTIQVAPDDCTGWHSRRDPPRALKEEVKHKSIDLEPKDEHSRSTRALRVLLAIPETAGS